MWNGAALTEIYYKAGVFYIYTKCGAENAVEMREELCYFFSLNKYK